MMRQPQINLINFSKELISRWRAAGEKQRAVDRDWGGLRSAGDDVGCEGGVKLQIRSELRISEEKPAIARIFCI